jgi:hypothetical protein
LCGDRRPITKWRGSILQTPCGKCVPTYHPAAILRQWNWKPVAELDIKRVAEESSSSVIELPRMSFDILPSYDRVMEYLHGLKAGDTVAFDIETTGRMVRMLGLSASEGHAISIPFITGVQGSTPTSVPGSPLISLETAGPTLASHWRAEQEYDLLAKLWDVFSNRSIRKVAQNFPFDSVVLAREFGFTQFPNLWMDTMLAWHTCYAELPKGLDFLCSVLTRVPYYSDYDASDCPL